jgi:RimJ/RimL family protein N-acetyltransferase
MRVTGSVELGALMFSPVLQRSTLATEALYLLIKGVFDLDYRRCEWRCNACNLSSISAALRLGFQYEGASHQAAVVKGRNRDTAYFAILDREWPTLQESIEAWLCDDNFDRQGRQLLSLRKMRSRFER